MGLIEEYNLIWENYESKIQYYIYLPIYGDSIRTEGTRNWGGDGKETPAEDPLKYIGNNRRLIFNPESIMKKINELGLEVMGTCCSYMHKQVHYHTRSMDAACYMKLGSENKKIKSRSFLEDDLFTDANDKYDEMPFPVDYESDIKYLEKNQENVKPFTSFEQMKKDFDEYVKVLKKDYKEPKQEPSEEFWNRKIHTAIQMDKIKNKKWDGD